LSDTPTFEAALMDFVLFPSERFGGFVVCGDECIDVLLQFLDGSEGSPVYRLTLQDGEPGLD
jgi:hypothetical protein